MEKNSLLKLSLAVVAVLILVGSAVAFYFSLQPKGDTAKVVVNGKDYPWDSLSQRFTPVKFTAVDGEHEGIRLSDLLNDTGLQDPGSHQYRMTGSDGYQKDVSWGDMTNGYLVVKEKRTVFPGLTKSFWVSDTITIEVV